MWSVVFALIPARYLYGAGAAIAALLLGWAAIAHYGNRREAAGWNAGYNHAVVVETRKQIVVVDSLEHRADSTARVAQRSDSLLAIATRPVALPPRVRFEPVTSADSALVPMVPIADLVRIYVASDSTNQPHYADRYIATLLAWEDSTIYLRLLPQRDSAIVLALAWKRAWGSEHEARLGADSLSALWRERALNIVAPLKQSHAKRDAVFAALGAVAGYIAAKRVH